MLHRDDCPPAARGAGSSCPGSALTNLGVRSNRPYYTVMMAALSAIDVGRRRVERGVGEESSG